MATPLLQIEGLKTYFHTDEGLVKAVDDVSFTIEPGQTLGVVGESGSGKSVTSLTVMRLLPEFSSKVAGGTISFLGKDLLSATNRRMCEIRGKDIAMIFQEPMTSLNPVFRVGEQVTEAILHHEKIPKHKARKRTLDLFREVGIPNPQRRMHSYPHELSGGQKQRVMIAMALSCNPQLLIADEPTTALDVTIQAQILDLLRELRDTRGMSILFITHDLGVIAEIADHVAVMFRGKLVEYGDVLSVFGAPEHPYTKGLLACRPRLDTPYRLLPTVDDFLETWVEDGEGQMREKELTPERLEELRTGTRDKMPEGVGQPMLSVTDLKVWFPLETGFFKKTEWVKAVDGISFEVFRGQTLGLVGESGCGKTTTGRAILGLVTKSGGTVTYQGDDIGFLADALGGGAAEIPLEDQTFLQRNLATLLKTAIALVAVIGGATQGIQSTLVTVLTALALTVLGGWGVWRLATWVWALWQGRADNRTALLRQKMQIIFQDPYSSLNPRLTVEQALTEPMRVHGIGKSHTERIERAEQLLEEVDLPREYLRRYPHEFSGGQRQRICIARALALEPEFIICDESVSALDVSVQAQVLNLLKRLQAKRGLTYIFISHDLSVVKFMSDTLAVMNDGKIVEMGASDAVYLNQKEEYTRQLIQAIPRDDLDEIRRRVELRKSVREAQEASA